MGRPVDETSDGDEPRPGARPPRRRDATVLQAKAAAHPLRLRILRLCAQETLTNKQLADRLAVAPGTTLYHLRVLERAGFVEAGPVRAGRTGALERPYRATRLSWWLDGEAPAAAGVPLASRARAVLAAFTEELAEAGPDAVQTWSRFVLHLSDEDARELERRLLAVLDEYVATDDQRLDRPARGGLVVLHRLAPAVPPDAAPASSPDAGPPPPPEAVPGPTSDAPPPAPDPG